MQIADGGTNLKKQSDCLPRIKLISACIDGFPST
jgi:hypothetical protein